MDRGSEELRTWPAFLGAGLLGWRVFGRGSLVRDDDDATGRVVTCNYGSAVRFLPEEV